MSRRWLLGIFGIAIRTTATVGAVAFHMWIGMTGCATGAPAVVSAPPSVEKAVSGKTKQELLTCTAIIPDESTLKDVTQLMFYQEASLLKESFQVSKGTVAQAHHGCLAHVRLIEGRVQSIHYHAVPPGYPAYDHCDAIFASCQGH